MSMLGVTVDDECFQMYQGMKQRRIKCINFKLSPDNTKIIVDQNSLKYSTMKKNVFQTWSGELPEKECLYSLYDFDCLVSMPGMSSTKRNKIGFIVWAPSCSKIKDRMVLASAKENLRRAIEGIQVEWQLNGREDIDVPDLINTLDNQPGIRHAGHIIGFENEDLKYWKEWKSEARSFMEINDSNAAAAGHLDHFDRMKAELDISQKSSKDIKGEKTVSEKSKSRYSTPSFPGVNRLEQKPDVPSRSVGSNSKYAAASSGISGNNESGSKLKYQLSSKTTVASESRSKYSSNNDSNTIEMPSTSKYDFKTVDNGEDHKDDQTNDKDKKKKKKKKKEDKDKDSGKTPEEKEAKRLKKEKKKAKKLRKNADGYHQDSGKRAPTVLERMAKMNLG